jgi:FimV-like protein
MDTAGLVYMNLGWGEQAVRILGKAVEMAPDNPDISLHLAQAYVQVGQRGTARSILERLISRQQDFSERGQAEELLKSL